MARYILCLLDTKTVIKKWHRFFTTTSVTHSRTVRSSYTKAHYTVAHIAHCEKQLAHMDQYNLTTAYYCMPLGKNLNCLLHQANSLKGRVTLVFLMLSTSSLPRAMIWGTKSMICTVYYPLKAHADRVAGWHQTLQQRYRLWKHKE